MAVNPQHKTLDLEEQLARIAKMRIETDKLIEEARFTTPQIIFQGAIAVAALLGAGAALAKLLFPG